jgi:hypothetical protein
MSIETNGVESTLVESPDDVQKRRYLDMVWSMSKEEMFKELMRVHAESTKMMLSAQTEIDNLRMTLAKLNQSIH